MPQQRELTLVIKLDHRLLLGLLICAAIGLPAWLLAGNLTIPHAFTGGTVADAVEMNANFNAVETEVDDNDSRLDTLESEISVTGGQVGVGSGPPADKLGVAATGSWEGISVVNSAASGDGANLHLASTGGVGQQLDIRCDARSGFEKVLFSSDATNGFEFSDFVIVKEDGPFEGLAVVNSETDGAGANLSLSSTGGVGQSFNLRNDARSGFEDIKFSTDAENGFTFNQNVTIEEDGTWKGLEIVNGQSDGAGAAISMHSTAGNNRHFTIFMDSRAGEDAVKFGTDSNGFHFENDTFTTGNIWLNGGVIHASDARIKTDFETIDHALTKLEALNGFRYRWKDAERGDDPQLGVVAQEVETVFPELVSERTDGMKSVNYSGLIPVLIEAAKELAATNGDQQKRILALEALINAQAERMMALERQIEDSN